MGWFDSAKQWVGEQARTVEVATQGVARGLASGIGSVGDLAVGVGYNWTVRHLTGGEPVASLADRAAEKVTWTEAKNDRERAIMAGGQVVGEVAGFVAVTVATGGVGGAAFGAARGTMAVARGVTAARAAAGTANAVRGASIAAETVAGATRAAAGTARFMNPLTSKVALGIEGGVGAWRGYDLYTTDQKAAALADTVRTEVAQTAINTAVNEQTALTNSAQRVQERLGTIVEQLNDPELSEERHAELMDQLDAIEVHNGLIQELQNGDITPAQREILWNELKATDPSVEADLKSGEPAASDSALGNEFKQAADGVQPKAPAFSGPEQKQTYQAPVISAPVV